MPYHWSSLVFLLLNSIVISLSDDIHWNYGDKGPEVWSDIYSVCDGYSQSPINIKTGCTTFKSFELFKFSPGYSALQNFTIINNGHTLIGAPVNNDSSDLSFTGGGLLGTFRFINFHLHWGENYRSGSEHQINGESFAGEIHLVHENPDINKYAALAIFMTSSRPENADSTRPASLQSKTKRRQTTEVIHPDNETSAMWEDYFRITSNLTVTTNQTIISLNLSKLISTKLENFYRYNGSITTPPCSESVFWTVFQTPIEFTEAEFETFRSHVFPRNFRPPKPLNNRIVFRSFPIDAVSSITDYSFCESNQSDTDKFSGFFKTIVNKESFSFLNAFLFISLVILIKIFRK